MLLVVGMMAWLSGCTKDTPGFCCSTLESCAQAGAGSVKTCEAGGSRPFCDDPGDHGPAHTCIPDPSAPGCESSLECTTPVRPVCDLDDTGTCVGCSSANDCTRFTEERLCNPDTRACVECVTSLDCATTNAPICDGDGTCTGCTSDAQCPSNVCDEGVGTCVLDADIIYVDPTGSGTACTSTTPCATLAAGVAAITPSRRYLKIAPASYAESVTLDGKNATLIGPGASIVPAVTGVPGVLVLNDSAVRIEGMRLANAGGGGGGDGIRCARPTAGNPSIRLIGVRIEGNSGLGVDASECAVVIDAGEIVDNPGGGVSISTGSFDIVNTFITGNGANTAVGGVRLMDNSATSRFEFNTVADNLTGGGAAQSLICTSVQAQRIGNNIFTGASATQVSSTNCNLVFNLANQIVAGEGNLNASPTFVSSTDFHLMPTSEGVDDAETNASLQVDADGDTRPQNGRRDMGADEVLP